MTTLTPEHTIQLTTRQTTVQGTRTKTVIGSRTTIFPSGRNAVVLCTDSTLGTLKLLQYRIVRAWDERLSPVILTSRGHCLDLHDSVGAHFICYFFLHASEPFYTFKATYLKGMVYSSRKKKDNN